jgi:hypothetical protein
VLYCKANNIYDKDTTNYNEAKIQLQERENCGDKWQWSDK